MIGLRILSRWCAATLAVGAVAGTITLAACSGNGGSQDSAQSAAQLGDPPDASCSCPGNFTACTLSGGVVACVDTDFDPTNCGSCGNACAFGQFCSSGACTGAVIDAGLTCPPPLTTCPFDGTDACVNTDVDPTNCGRCGNTCAFGQFCSNGTCTGTAFDAGITCPPGTTSCPFDGTNVCTNTAFDPTNCGRCGITCALGQFCTNGACTGTPFDAGVTCPSGTTACTSGGFTVCTSTAIDPSNCGACGNACAFGQFCTNGACTGTPFDAGVTCPAGTTACAVNGITACLSTSIDPTNCGACGNACALGQFCVNGACTGTPFDAGFAAPTCPLGTTACTSGGVTSCVNTEIDPSNCGACGNACAFGDLCTNGRCSWCLDH